MAAKKPNGSALKAEMVPLASIKPHPRNYRNHPDDQLAHIVASIKEHGFYRNIVVARDGTILAGHGVAKASAKLGLEEVPVVRVDLDPDEPRALKLLAGDNEMLRLAETDDRALTELLKELAELDAGLLGTGFDEQMLAALVMVSRPTSEIADANAAAEWAGMPEFQATGMPLKLVVSFRNNDDRLRFMKLIGATYTSRKFGPTWTLWWPEECKKDLASLKFEEAAK